MFIIKAINYQQEDLDMAHCRECRFYDGTGCPGHGKVNGGSSISSCFVPYSGPIARNQCRTCRFFDGLICKSGGAKVNGGNSPCSKYVPFV